MVMGALLNDDDDDGDRYLSVPMNLNDLERRDVK